MLHLPTLLKKTIPLGAIASALLLALSPSCVQGKEITVAADGSGDFKTIQEAIEAVPDKSTDQTIIHIKPGVYEGQKILPAGKNNVTFQGENAETTVLTWDINTNEEQPPGTNLSHKGTGVVILGDDFHADKLTFQNTSGDHGQALALRIDGDRAIVTNCRLLGWQDTLMCNNARQYFKDCYIEGRVDFIYGGGTAVFDHCEIHSKNGGFITAAATPPEHPFGFVFFDCKLTGSPDAWVDPTGKIVSKPQNNPLACLGRPWRPNACVTYLNCEMGAHIKPEGWNNWGNVANETTARYSEYNSTGPGATPDKRAPWSKQLSKDDADKITIEAVLGGSDNWKPN